MTTEIRVPTLGESVVEATVGQWFKQAGEEVAADEPLVELETDKVTVEVPAPSAGVLSEIVVKEGDMGESLFLILRGVIRVSRESEGEEKDIATLYAGDFFGEIALLKSVPRIATCRAVTPCSLFELRRSDFEVVKEKYPLIEAKLEQVMATRI